MINTGVLFAYNIIIVYSLYRMFMYGSIQNDAFPYFCVSHTTWCFYYNTIFIMVTCFGTRLTQEVKIHSFRIVFTLNLFII